jgi:hypothetical protein
MGPAADGVPVELGGTRNGTGRPLDPFCRWCGAPRGGCDQVSCRPELDPPHACPTCGGRLRLAVHPMGYTATCRVHGEVTE